MDDDRRRVWATPLLFLVWTFLGAVIVSAFYVASFFAAFSALLIGDRGAALLLVPLLTGFLLGVLLTDAEIAIAAGAGVLCASLAVGLVALFLFSPVLAGVAATSTASAGLSLSSIALSTIVLFPLVVVGSAIGRGVGDLFLPSAQAKRRSEQLREDTRRWHASLKRPESGEASANGINEADSQPRKD